MAILAVGLTGENGQQGKDGSTFNRTYRVKTALNDHIGTVYAAVWTPTGGMPFALPVRGNTLKTWNGATDIDTYAIVTDVQVDLSLDDKTTDGYWWDYSVTYTKDLKLDGTEGAENPLNRPPDISLDVNYVEEEMIKDVDNVFVTNSAKTRLTNPPKREVGSGVIVIERNESANPIGMINTYSGSVNSAGWNGVAAQKARVKISASKQYEGEYSFWRVRYEISVSQQSYRAKALDIATTEWKQIEGQWKQQQILDPNGNPTQVLLNGSGSPLSSNTADPVEYPSSGWKRYTETSWSGLALPNPFTA